MRNNPENNSAMRKSADSLESADSTRQNSNELPYQQNNYTKKRLLEQKEIEVKEHQKADTDLENALSTLGISATNKEVSQTRSANLEVSKELSTEDQIKNYKTELANQGKSQTEVLKFLVTRFDGNKELAVWIENWKSFLELHNFAQSKPPKEREAIQNIIFKADFSNANAFNTSLAEIGRSSEISRETKLEISKNFNGSKVMSVDGLDNTLKEVKSYKTKIESAINTKNKEKEKLDSEIETLETKIHELPFDSPERQQLETEIEQKKNALANTESTLAELEKSKPKNVSFELREGVFAKLNPDGTRSINIPNENFSFKIPSNHLPFTTTKNLRAINLAFPYSILKKNKVAHLIFPNLEKGAVPSKSNRIMGHLILNSLGINDSKILSQEKINQLDKSLNIFDFDNGKTALENLTTLGIYNIQKQSLDNIKLKEYLTYHKLNKSNFEVSI